MTRLAAKAAFLAAHGWGDAQCAFLAGDASSRTYDRLWRGNDRAVLMDAPPGQGDDPALFIKIGGHLRGLGLSAPKVIAQDLTHGFLLLEDLGDALFAREIASDPAVQSDLYAAATDVLVHLQANEIPIGLPDLTARLWAEAAAFALDWYRFAIVGTRVDTTDFVQAMTGALDLFTEGPRVMILRDYHAENLIWLPERQGLARVGLLDFQLAQAGQPGYDLVSLLQDARRDVPQAMEADMIKRFAASTGRDADAFRRSYAALGAQRALRVLGIFARLCLVAGKSGYLAYLPRVWGQLQRNLAQPGMQDLARACECLPQPNPAALEKIGTQCGNFR